MSCSRGRRQPFACGHKGFGELCHRCKQANELEAASAKEGKEKAEVMRKEAARLKSVPRKSGSMQAATPAA